MKWNKHSVASVFVMLMLVSNTYAGDPCRKFLGCPVPDCIGKWCCDDYTPKCLPCVQVPLCFGCDDYCRKPMPRVCAPLCFTCDDYCKKCQPPVCRPPLLGNLSCVPERRGCACDSCQPTGGQSIGSGKRVNPLQIVAAKVASRQPEIIAGGAAATRLGVKPAELTDGEPTDTEQGDVDAGQQAARRPVFIEIFNR